MTGQNRVHHTRTYRYQAVLLIDDELCADCTNPNASIAFFLFDQLVHCKEYD